MNNDGKQLEGLVAFVEKTLLPQGFEVKANDRVFNDEGIQIAEFDILIRGKMGSTNMAWLIECRDRPGAGPAPGSWIEQLVGRRARFKFNKVTAVSTTGFAAGAIEFAKAEGIELREVRELTPDQFSGWLVMRHLHHIENLTQLDHASLILDKNGPPETLEAAIEALSTSDGNSKILRSVRSCELSTLANAFLAVVQAQKTLFDEIEANGPGRKVAIQAQYINDEDHFVLETSVGPIRVREIIFEGHLIVKDRLVPLSITAEYREAESGRQISQVASFEPQMVEDVSFAVEIHRMADSGTGHIVVRRLGPDA